jgi:iron(III) transport system permease protein
MTALAERLARAQRPRIPFDGQAILFAIVLGLVIFFVLYPALLIVLYSFHAGIPGQDLVFSLEGWRTALNEPNMRVSIVNTVKMLVTVQVIALPIGVIIAWLLARTDMPGRRAFEFLFWISFFLPTLTMTMGWILCMDPQFGLFNKALRWAFPFLPEGEGPFNIYSYWGVVWAHLFSHAISVKVALLTPGFRNMDASHEEASRIAGASRSQTLARIVVPAMLPAILVVEMIAAIRAMQAFEIEVILGPPFDFYVYSTKIFNLLLFE